MCLAIIRFDPDHDWPVLLAFVRDEERSRPSSMPSAWWSDYPSVIGGRDDLAGGTWLAVDTSTEDGGPRAACVLNRREQAPPVIPVGERRTRGLLPLDAAGAGGFDEDPGALRRFEPFTLVEAHRYGVRWRHWTGSQLTATSLEPGWHVITSHGLDAPNRRGREEIWLPRFARAPLPPLRGKDTATAWGSWVDLLDGRGARVDDPDAIVIGELSAAEGFGTVGATLIGLSATGAVRYDANLTHDLDPSQWSPVL